MPKPTYPSKLFEVFEDRKPAGWMTDDKKRELENPDGLVIKSLKKITLKEEAGGTQ